MRELPKAFEHSEVDPRWYAFWESIGAFRANPASGKPRFSMVIPPPNVTGSLHMGHALNHTMPDIIARWKRMQGYDVLWLPGTDHAGIATQNVVEKQLAKEGKTRHDLGREAFEARVWDWVKQSHGTITGQMRKLGESVDWTRERFTLDEQLSRAVRRVFVSLYEEGLIYRGTYIVNWCPRCRTALSDLEVVHKDTTGKLWYVRYPGADGGEGVVVATTRPETMLGDTAVAVNPDDERYRDRIGQTVRLPIIGRDLTIIADEFVDPAFGTGAVKVTPAHDPNDFQMGKRHGLLEVAVIDEDGRITPAGGPFAGLDRFKARAGVVERLEAEGLLVKVADHQHAVGTCQRCSTVVEPLVSTQWFVKVAPLAQEAIRVVENGQVRFLPENWTKTYYDWMYNIHDWCISRQLWWGHRIPAWYCEVVQSDDRGRAGARAMRVRRRPDAGQRRARHVVQLAALAVQHDGLAGPDRGLPPLLPDRPDVDRVRHHLLLGCADDHVGRQVHGRHPVPRRVHHRPRARRARPEDVEVEGERRRSAGGHGRDWRRRAEVHAHRDGGAGDGHPALGRADDRLPAVHQQDLERVAIRADEPRRRSCPRGGAVRLRRSVSCTAGSSIG